MSFRQNYDLEEEDRDEGVGLRPFGKYGFDNGNNYQEIIAAGGSFVVGGYNHKAINTDFMNPCMQQYA